MTPIVRSARAAIAWPALPAMPGAQQMALQYQLQNSQWWSAEDLLSQQFRQIQVLLRHALNTVPYYREAYADLDVDITARLDPERFARLPLLTRAGLQAAATAMRSTRIPARHGPLHDIKTSGSTGTPVQALGSEVTRLFWRAFTLRDHLWQKRDFSGKLLAIRTEGNALGAEGHTQQSWGPATDACFVTGPSALLGLRNPVEVQAEWLARHNPNYLLSHPSNLLALTRYFKHRGLSLPGLKQVRSFGEILPDAVRDACRSVWGVGVADVYSSQELGYIALQCPERPHYHVQAEGVYVEVLDAEGRPCAPGQIGRVVVTGLHNFATPMIRYELGDYAEVGSPCDCGRGLPVLKRILGRTRNMLTLPDGRQYWPSFPEDEWMGLAPIRQMQLIQHDVHSLEARIVPAAEFTSDQSAALIHYLQRCFAYPFAVTVSFHADLARAANGKFEDFISKVSV